MNERQQREVEIVTRLQAGALDVATAAELLGVSVRQVRRRRERFREAGMAAVLHGTSGRAPANRTAPALLAGIVALAGPGGKYHALNGCHLPELLECAAQIVSGRATLERLLKPTGMRQPAQTAPPVQRRRRLRRSAEGMRLQIAGSACAWLAARAAPADLIGAIAHATGTGLLLHFRPSQDQVGYLRLLRSIAQDDGLPMSLYHDRHTSLRSPKQPTLEEQLAGHMPLRQVQRGMAALGIESSAAYAPQAKDRLERVWGTRQERLTKELRRAGSNDLEQAHAFLPGFMARYHVRFAQAPQDPQTAGVPLPADLDMPSYCAIRATRTLRTDHCISCAGQLLHLVPGPTHPSLVGQRVSVPTTPEGDLYVYHDKRRIAHPPGAAAPPATPTDAAQPNAPPGPAQRTAQQRAWLFGQH